MSIDDMEQDLLQHYRELHDGLSDMIEEGRLQQADIPEDYQWLVEMLVTACGLDHAVETAIAAENDETFPPLIWAKRVTERIKQFA